MTEYGRIHTDGSRSGGQPVEAQQRALAIANTLLGIDRATLGELSHHELMMALVRIVPQHDAARQELRDFKQKVSDAAKCTLLTLENDCHTEAVVIASNHLLDFIIHKPDPLINVAKMLGYYNTAAKHLAGDIRAALDAAGFEIREKNDDQPNSN